MKESGPPQKRDENSSEQQDLLKKAEKQKPIERKHLATETFRLLEHFYDDLKDINFREDFIKALKADDMFKQGKIQKKFAKVHKKFAKEQKEHKENEEHIEQQLLMDEQILRDEISGFKRGIVKRDPQLLEKLLQVKNANLGFFELGELRWFNLDDEIEKVKTRVVQYLDQLKKDVEILLDRMINTNYGDADSEKSSQLIQREKVLEELRAEIARVELLIKK
jgi:hypothetical protein